ncbi:MAG: adenosine deaminase [Thermoflexales bacterium]|nr:adenosine deaminase [Thermoflexales bacterium]
MICRHLPMTDTADEIQEPQSLRAQLHALPKIDLHRHLEGSLRLETLAEIAVEHGVDLPSYDLNELRPLVQVTENDPPGFLHFLEKFKLLRRFYTSREAVERIAYEAAADAAADNVKYLELRFNPVALAKAQSFRYRDVMAWVWQAVQRAQAEYDITVRLLVSANRQEPEQAIEMVKIALEYGLACGVVGIDVSGDEVNYPIEPFVPLFRQARQMGVHITVHAGEAGGASNVREAIEVLDAERIGHGVRAIENSSVVKLVRDRRVALEVCPLSNLQTGVMREWGHHPLPDLYRLGVRTTINTDDPSISSTTLTDEYLVVLTTMRMKLGDIKQMLINSAQAAFLPQEEKDALETRLRSEMGM